MSAQAAAAATTAITAARRRPLLSAETNASEAAACTRSGRPVAAARAERLGDAVALLGGQARQQVAQPRAAQARDERAHRRDAERAADHAAHREDARGDAGLLARDRVHRGRAIGDITSPMPRPIRTNAADEEAVAGVHVRWPCQNSEAATSSSPGS